MKRYLLIISFILFVQMAYSQTERPLRFKGYSGGMMVHSGYLSSGELSFVGSGGTTRNININGAPFGIGGALRLHFGEHLRIGTEGYSSNLKYGENGSYEHIGWGGILLDWAWTWGRFSTFVGATLGGGGVKNVSVFENSYSDFILDEGTTSYRKYTFMCVDPFIGIEYALNSKIHLVMKADYLMNVSNPQADFATGPRLYFGFMFCH